MKTAISIIATIIVLVYLGDITITFKPFSVKINSWDIMISFILVSVGMIILCLHIYNEGQKDILKELNQEVQEIKVLKEKYSEKS